MTDVIMAEDENVERADVTHARVFADALRLPVDGAKALDEDTINTAIQKIFDPATHCSDANVKAFTDYSIDTVVQSSSSSPSRLAALGKFLVALSRFQLPPESWRDYQHHYGFVGELPSAIVERLEARLQAFEENAPVERLPSYKIRLHYFLLAHDLTLRLARMETTPGHKISLDTPCAQVLQVYLFKLAQLAVTKAPDFQWRLVAGVPEWWLNREVFERGVVAKLVRDLDKLRHDDAGEVFALLDQDEVWHLPKVHGSRDRDWYEQPATLALRHVKASVNNRKAIPRAAIQPVQIKRGRVGVASQRMVDKAKGVMQYVKEINTGSGEGLTDVVDVDAMGQLLYKDPKNPSGPPVWRRNYYGWSKEMVAKWRKVDSKRKLRISDRKKADLSRAKEIARLSAMEKSESK